MKSAKDVEREGSQVEELEELLLSEKSTGEQYQHQPGAQGFKDTLPVPGLRRESFLLRRLAWTGTLSLWLILFTYFFVPNFFTTEDGVTYQNEFLFNGETVRSNGTHEYKRTVLMVSIDGLRADYLDRGLTPHLLAISKKGLRARSMKPIFPTLTFPNHWALMTGLYAESHGIVANNFWDPVSQEEFHYNQAKSAWKSTWWLGEPIWETAEKAGVTTANLMWPGPPRTTSNVSSTYFVPWKDKVSLDEKLSQILEWVDMPFEERPQLILAYEPSLDQAGHATGPNSARTNATLSAIDKFAENLQLEIEARNLTSILDIIFVSDHGMTDTSAPELIYLDDYIGTQGVRHIEHMDGWPALGLRFDEDLSEKQVLQYVEKLVTGSQIAGTFDVFARSDHPARGIAEAMRERWHYDHNERIAPIWVVPKIGYVITTKAMGDDGMNLGSHGYDNTDTSMHAMFVAHGPFSHQAKFNAQLLASQRRTASKGCHARADANIKLNGWDLTPPSHASVSPHTEKEDEYIMETFPNLEIYNLIIKLLGIDQMADARVAPNNGTAGFWETYL